MDLFNLNLTKDLLPLEKLGRFISGVYAYFDAEGECLYIGQSKDVRGRLQEHKRKAWGKEIHTIRAIPIRDVSDRLIAETVLQLRHFPRYTRTVKLGLNHSTNTVVELQFIRTRRA